MIWIVSILLCSPLFHLFDVSRNRNGKLTCRNSGWSNRKRLIYYIVFTICSYLLPLLIMMVAHIKLSLLIKRSVEPSINVDRHEELSVHTREYQENIMKARMIRNRKAIQMLVIIVGLFFILWTPLVVLRMVKYSGVEISNKIWTVSKGIALISTCANFVVYMSMNKNLRETVKSFFRCTR